MERFVEAPAVKVRTLELAIGSGRVRCVTEDVATARVVLTPVEPGDTEAQDRIAAARLEFIDGVLYVTEPEGTHHSGGNSIVIGDGNVVSGVSGVSIQGNSISIGRVAGTIRVGGRTVISGNVGFSIGPGIAVDVVLPHGVAFDGKAVSADIALHGYYRRVDATTRQGTVTINDVEHARVKTSQGDIRVGRSGGGRYKTSQGNVLVGTATGEHDLVTSQGNIRVDAASGGIDAKTSQGNIDLTAVGEGLADLRTSMGDIDVRRVGDIDFRAKGRSSMGSVRGA